MMAWVLEIITKVWPSVGDLMAARMPSAPPAPGMFSSTTCWPRASPSFCAMGRITVSPPPPAARSVPTKVVLPPDTTLRLLPAWKEPVTASDDLEFSTVTLTPALKLLVLDWVPLVFLSSLTP